MHKVLFLVPLFALHLIAQPTHADEATAKIEKVQKELQGTWLLVVLRTDQIDLTAEMIKKVDLKMGIEGKNCIAYSKENERTKRTTPSPKGKQR
jgi:hypothetical protein